jgi:hypothetical protein
MECHRAILVLHCLDSGVTSDLTLLHS